MLSLEVRPNIANDSCERRSDIATKIEITETIRY